MSGFQAIGGVSATLRTLLEDRMELPPGADDFLVTISTPRPEEQSDQQGERARINLFLYRTTENGYLKNQEIPGQGHPARRSAAPVARFLRPGKDAYSDPYFRGPDRRANPAGQDVLLRLLERHEASQQILLYPNGAHRLFPIG